MGSFRGRRRRRRDKSLSNSKSDALLGVMELVGGAFRSIAERLEVRGCQFERFKPGEKAKKRAECKAHPALCTGRAAADYPPLVPHSSQNLAPGVSSFWQ